ncbi:NAD(P)-dependent oxidoreductase [Weizmannia acidilactici]|uniref:NAD(P)-dependent oxidoreductase n=1 Tax=Weizmannia acidilactici TaxID=2607726 RepID=UPI00124CC544|nr:NAD(P)-dependent oxidoreductase [Weizmannia acidilactici]
MLFWGQSCPYLEVFEMKIGWIGLGHMGSPMAKRILNAKFELFVYNRTQSKTEELASSGATVCTSPQEIAEKADVIVTMLTDNAAVEEVLRAENGILSGLSEGKTVIDMSTVSPDDSVRFAEWVKAKGGHFMDAPVSGSVQPAKEGNLVILVGGEKEQVDVCRPIFDVLGKTVIHFGENGKGSAAKLSINLLLGLIIQGASEALLLGEKLGLKKENIIEMISASACNTPIFQMKKNAFLNETFPAAFMLELMSKDLGLAKAEIEKNAMSLPLAGAVEETYRNAKANGAGKEDVAAVYRELKHLNF